MAGCRRRSRHQGGRCGRRPARASHRRHGLDRAGKLARADDPIGRREATAQTMRISSWSCAEPPREFRRFCGAPPTCRAASLRLAAIPFRASYVKAARRARRHLDRACAGRGYHRRRAQRRRGGDRCDLHSRCSGAIIGKGKVTRKAVQYTSEAFDIGTHPHRRGKQASSCCM